MNPEKLTLDDIDKLMDEVYRTGGNCEWGSYPELLKTPPEGTPLVD